MLNENNLRVGIWKALCCTPPQKIDGYMIGGEANYEVNWEDDPYASEELVLCDEDKWLAKFLTRDTERAPMPQTPSDFGLSWEKVFEEPGLIEPKLNRDYFEECVSYFERRLSFYEMNMVSMQKNNPVDIMFFYSPVLDFIQHFTNHDPELNQINRAMSVLDQFIGRLVSKLAPENIAIFSDHGITALDKFFPDTPTTVQREAFGWRDHSIWLKNGKIIARGRNNGFISGIHSIKGCFIMSGNAIRHEEIKHMRVIDIYPTLLEMFDVRVPKNREGYVHDIYLNKKIINTDKLLCYEKVKSTHICIIQNIDIPQFNRVLNEVFLDNRFCMITVLGDEKYKNILLADPRVDNFVPILDKKIDPASLSGFEKIIVPYFNNATNELDYIQI